VPALLAGDHDAMSIPIGSPTHPFVIQNVELARQSARQSINLCCKNTHPWRGVQDRSGAVIRLVRSGI